MVTKSLLDNLLDYDIILSKFELQSQYYVPFQNNTLEKIWTSLSPPPPAMV